jgi:adenylylsulfate kinase-like enzyme
VVERRAMNARRGLHVGELQLSQHCRLVLFEQIVVCRASQMKLIFLHGAPATGKLTVAKALLRVVPGRLFDNHAAIDLAETVFDFGAPGFWELVQTVRCAVLEAAAGQGVPLVVATYCYAEPEDRAAFAQFEAIIERHGGELLPVFLHCSREEMTSRVSDPERAARGKISTVTGLDDFLAKYDLVPVARADCLMLDSAAKSADAIAQDIIRHFALVASQGS